MIDPVNHLGMGQIEVRLDNLQLDQSQLAVEPPQQVDPRIEGRVAQRVQDCLSGVDFRIAWMVRFF